MVTNFTNYKARYLKKLNVAELLRNFDISRMSPDLYQKYFLGKRVIFVLRILETCQLEDWVFRFSVYLRMSVMRKNIAEFSNEAKLFESYH